MVQQNIDTSSGVSSSLGSPCGASRLGPWQRRNLSIAALDKRSALYGQRMAQGQNLLKDRWYPIRQAVLEAMAQTPRASSMVENLHRRLRFFLNHRRFLRRDRPERVGNSPAELLSGGQLWLETYFQDRRRHLR